MPFVHYALGKILRDARMWATIPVDDECIHQPSVLNGAILRQRIVGFLHIRTLLITQAAHLGLQSR